MELRDWVQGGDKATVQTNLGFYAIISIYDIVYGSVFLWFSLFFLEMATLFFGVFLILGTWMRLDDTRGGRGCNGGVHFEIRSLLLVYKHSCMA